MSTEVIVAIIGLVGILYIAWRDHNSAGDTLVQDAMSMLDRLQADMVELKKRDKQREKEMQALTAELQYYKHITTVLIVQLRSMGVEPAIVPKEDKGKS